ncbi:hypothetical protein PAAG_11106 [Paracoccidioides lutzii Pb01]|uniref:Uncharacterized protein n=1 Tax=Paracoccidioides lutzii (strain ATCC MYA-826 / Pb01) TaxID=502779 RepID=A0A0A2V3X3_PARBA|nr:hypothetical protein PAAG_11106 [Paracoccidioides lutzii Pb01]KGQ02153.1 hypothetical protein PAAG_11106 [Paracoccidioides lutzii Pb01]
MIHICFPGSRKALASASRTTPRARPPLPRSFVPAPPGLLLAPIGGCPLAGGAIGQFGSNHEAPEFSAASAVIGPSGDYVNLRRPSRLPSNGSGFALSRRAT